MKSVFIGSKNEFDQMIVHWLSENTQLEGVVWSGSGRWRKSWCGRINYALKRMKKYGFFKVIDEIFLFYYVKKKVGVRDLQNLQEDIIYPYFQKKGLPKKWQFNGPAIFSDSIKDDPEVMNFIKKIQPDIIFAMCLNDFFPKKLRQIPKHGVYLWHEGITPEYKGLYSPFWTLYNKDYSNLGYTFLKMNNKIDAGEIYVQGKVKDINLEKHGFSYIGHKAIYDSLNEVKEFLEKLPKNQHQYLDRKGAKNKNYTYPGIIDYLLMDWRLKKKLKKSKAEKVA